MEMCAHFPICRIPYSGVRVTVITVAHGHAGDCAGYESKPDARCRRSRGVRRCSLLEPGPGQWHIVLHVIAQGGQCARDETRHVDL